MCVESSLAGLKDMLYTHHCIHKLFYTHIIVYIHDTSLYSYIIHHCIHTSFYTSVSDSLRVYARILIYTQQTPHAYTSTPTHKHTHTHTHTHNYKTPMRQASIKTQKEHAGEARKYVCYPERDLLYVKRDLVHVKRDH